MELQGTLTTGLEEGSFFMSLEPYIIGIEKKLKFAPFKGTLNLKVNSQEAKKFIKSIELKTIEGFKKGIKKFGYVKCYPCKIKHIPCAIIVPEFTRHGSDIVEVIAEVYLRGTLNLKDGDKLTIEAK
jgi:riboflavin kinase